MSDERTEPASPQRLERAREEGQVAQSRELTGVVVMIAVTATIALGIGDTAAALRSLWQEVAGRCGGALDPEMIVATIRRAGSVFVRAIAPPLGVAFGLGVLLPWLQARPVPSAEPMRPKWERLEPFGRMRQMWFSAAGWVGLARSLLQLLIVIGVVATMLASWLRPLVASTGASLPAIATAVAPLAPKLVFVVAAPMLVIGVLDLLFQKWNLTRSLRMSTEELRRELRDDEGSPEMRSARDRQQRELEALGTRRELLESRVVVTNPTHLACALAYDPRVDAAPRLVAKAEGELARQLRSTARAAGIPIKEDKPLARALFVLPTRTEIPPELYEAAAVVLRWADRPAARNGGGPRTES